MFLDPWLLLGFAVAAWSVIANDSIQTLGTFLASNRQRPWWLLWLFGGGVLAACLLYGWWANDGDAAWGRLARFGEPPREATWLYLIPPLVLLAITRLGIPVSTTFLVLTVFSPENLVDMLAKSGLGYLVALAVGFGVYRRVVHLMEIHFLATREDRPGRGWVIGQWLATGFLWSQWLIQDLANLYVYLPRRIGLGELLASLAVILVMLAIVFRAKGGVIQGIVTRKVNTLDVRSATVIDLIYGLILLVFKEASDLPMSTTWVFLGLLAGREIALTIHHGHRTRRETLVHVAEDAGRATIGLLVSVVIALGLPPLVTALTG